MMARFQKQTICAPLASGRPSAPLGTRAVVLGGGIAGIAAATILTERGVEVTLVEGEPALGGRAGGTPETLTTGETVEMERGFHAFFRQYYNLRALLRRIDPELSRLKPLEDYPIFGPEGRVQSFRGLPKRTPWQIIALALRSPYLRAADLPKIDVRAALQMLAFDPQSTYSRYDALSAAEYLDSLGFTPVARRMLFDVFAHSFFNPEVNMSAAELLMMFHFYFTGNPEGLVFDVSADPMTRGLWQPFGEWLRGRGVELRLGQRAQNVQRHAGRYVVETSQGSCEGQFLVLALDVPGLHGLVAASEALRPLQSSLATLQVTDPFVVWRLWLDRPVCGERPPFAGTTGVGLLDNISVYNHFQNESRAWATAHRGAVVELHAYAVPPGTDEAQVRRELREALNALYPECKAARVLDERFLWRQDCPGFAPNQHARRPGVATVLPDVALAGDAIALPFPCALMERAAASGMLAASTLLAPLGVQSEPLHSVPTHGLFASPFNARFPHEVFPIPVAGS